MPKNYCLGQNLKIALVEKVFFKDSKKGLKLLQNVSGIFKIPFFAS